MLFLSFSVFLVHCCVPSSFLDLRKMYTRHVCIIILVCTTSVFLDSALLPLGAPPPKRRRLDSMELLQHATGSARSEGYYKIDAREKVKYLPHHRMRLKPSDKVSTCMFVHAIIF